MRAICNGKRLSFAKISHGPEAHVTIIYSYDAEISFIKSPIPFKIRSGCGFACFACSGVVSPLSTRMPIAPAVLAIAMLMSATRSDAGVAPQPPVLSSGD